MLYAFTALIAFWIGLLCGSAMSDERDPLDGCEDHHRHFGLKRAQADHGDAP